MAITGAWREFTGESWREAVDVGGFVEANQRPYAGDDSFLAGPTPRTTRLWESLAPMLAEERRRGIHDVDPHAPSSIASHAPGWIDRGSELIVGLQTGAPLRRAIMPNAGLRPVQAGLAAHGYGLDSDVRTIYTQYRRTRLDGVLDAYPAAVSRARRAGVITGPDVHRVAGDYRRVALYGVQKLIDERRAIKAGLDDRPSDEATIRDREELAEQIRALEDLRFMADRYGHDISGPATDGREAIQWLYFAYLAAVKEQSGEPMSLGETSPFLDIYLRRDLAEGTLTESQAQELIDDFMIKLRLVRFLGVPSSGAGAILGGPVVTRTCYRYLQSLRNLGASSAPQVSVFWSSETPAAFARFCARVSLGTSSLRYGDEQPFPGTRADLHKALLYAINGGRDEHGQVTPPLPPLTEDVLDHDRVDAALDPVLDWLARTYMDGLRVGRYMQDKYAYERLELALLDYPFPTTTTVGIAGLPAAVDTLSAIKHAQVKALRDPSGLVVDFAIDGSFPAFGDDNPRVDAIVVDLVSRFMERVRRQPAYRGQECVLGTFGPERPAFPDAMVNA